ncbi:hypothetical protein JW921_03700, partial [Candidatus Fermentibacterales bacterium]|nr:hypothetical protein [Candidatus Fermentibacterales bacterium]
LLETSPEFLPVSSSVNLPGAEGMMAAVEARESGGKSRARIADTLRRELLRSLERKGVGFSVVGGNAETVPGSALLELSEVPCPDLWARIERAGILLASPFSARRLAYLRSLGLDYGHPGRYLGVFLSDNCSMVDVEVLAGTVASALCGS